LTERSQHLLDDRGRAGRLKAGSRPLRRPCARVRRDAQRFFADHGTKTAAAEAVQRIRNWATQRNTVNIAIARSYVDGTAPFPDRVAVLPLPISPVGCRPP